MLNLTINFKPKKLISLFTTGVILFVSSLFFSPLTLAIDNLKLILTNFESNSIVYDFDHNIKTNSLDFTHSIIVTSIPSLTPTPQYLFVIRHNSATNLNCQQFCQQIAPSWELTYGECLSVGLDLLTTDSKYKYQQNNQCQIGENVTCNTPMAPQGSPTFKCRDDLDPFVLSYQPMWTKCHCRLW